ncbi:efflux RND transporter permease subunit [Niabella sp. CC-SYL272]|uniref:efflux RND transporter permease subunit n=1 Tax=Niabella agricola TaxID=2891571 RepID=UPI001F1B310C|nr:efflux RND transporter permease subunit [Niabella agricola]MCF3109668.1 efflux RND transporter permease subunit [Niabella agricola]
MSALENFTGKFKEFFLTSWAVKNRTTVYLLIVMVSLFGVYKFVATPKESFPDVVIPNVYISTIYVGNSPKDIENLVTQPIEKQLKGMTGVKVTKVTSSSFQDYSSIMVEFGSDEKVEVALQKVKDAIDKARQDLPTDLTQEPTALEVSMSEMPIMYVNLSGDIDRVRLKEYADKMKDRIEELPQITRVDLVGAPEREFQINVDNAKMQAAGVTFDDIANAVKAENRDISGGLLEVGNMRRNLQLKGQFKTARDIEEVIVRNNTGNPIYLKNIAAIKDTIKETDSYARLDGKTVLTLNIVKRSGENLIETSDAVKAISEDMKKTVFPQNLNVTITGDQSISTRTSFNDLVNSIVIGFILVLIILMFFMGLTNAFFVALSVPLSMFVAFMFIPVGEAFIGTNITLNFMVLFALLFGLGIIVDDAIVVIENTHRIFTEAKGKISPQRASMMAAGEVFVPVLAGTLTTLAPFVPLLFWPGIIGKFMIYLPLMLIFTLAASLFVAFLMNPVFAVDFMNHPENPEHKKKSDVFRSRPFVVMIIIGVLFDLIGIPMGKGSLAFFIGNLSFFMAILTVLHTYFFDDWIHKFQNRALPWIMGHYEDLLNWALKGWRPVWLLLGAFGLLIVSFMMFGASAGAGRTKIVFFPSSDPNFIYVYLKLPSGTDVKYTDSITRSLESKVNQALDIDPAKGKKNAVVESVIANVAVGAADPNSGDRSTRSNLGRIQVSFVEFEKRHGVSTAPYLTKVRQAIKNIPGAEISVEQEKNGPPTDPPINIEVASEEFDNLIPTAVSLKNYLDSLQIPGVEELKMDVDLSSPEVTLKVNRERALSEGVSSGQIGMQIRTALFGDEASKIKNGKDEYKIYVRNTELQRKNLTDLLNMNVVFRDMATGKIKSVPISSVVDVDYTNTLGSVQRKNQKRMITLRSNVLEAEGYTPTAVNAQIKSAIDNFHAAGDDVTIKQTGEGEQQAETGAFLGRALMIALGLILLILVWQFNSMSKSVIILTEIIFSIIGVLLGFTLTGMAVSVVMTGVGILGLAGIVIKNGILVIEFADELRARGLKTREAVIQAGKTRIIPVLLTALAAIMALIPLAVGFNINFVTMFSELNPKIFFGGDNVMFWKPLSWTIIFGLAFAFFMTLVMVPSMYLIAERLKRPMRNTFGGKWISFLGIPPAILLFIPLMLYTMFRQRRKVARRRNRLAARKNTVNEAYIGSWF